MISSYLRQSLIMQAHGYINVNWWNAFYARNKQILSVECSSLPSFCWTWNGSIVKNIQKKSKTSLPPQIENYRIQMYLEGVRLNFK